MDRDSAATAAPVPVGVPVVPGEHETPIVRGMPIGNPVSGTESSPQTLQREREQLAAVVRAAAEDEIQRMQTALRTMGNAQIRHAEEGMRSTARHQQEAFARTIESAAWQAQQRVQSSVHESIDSQLEPALQTFLANTPKTSKLVDRVATSLERQVEERATLVVRRLAAEEAVTHALSRELESKVDSRMLNFWTGWLCSTATLAAASFAWHWFDSTHRRVR